MMMMHSNAHSSLSIFLSFSHLMYLFFPLLHHLLYSHRWGGWTSLADTKVQKEHTNTPHTPHHYYYYYY